MIELIRFGLFKDRTIGRLTYNDEHFYTIERPWLDNKQNVSCIPAGYYKLGRVDSPRFGPDTWEIKGVPNRAECKIHAANYWRQLNGCIAPGKERTYIDGDDVLDVSNSGDTLILFHKAMGNQTEAEIHIINIKQLI